MANITNPKVKFGVVYGAPSQLSAEKIEEGKLYFLAGDESNGIKQGIYGVNPLTSDVSNGVFDLALFGTGAIANGTGYGLSQYNFDNTYKVKLEGIEANANNYSHPGIGNADTNKTLNASDGTYISGIKRDSSGHIVDISTSAISSMSVENAVNATNAVNASTADNAKKVEKTFDISFGGSDIITYNGSANKTLGIKAGDSKTIIINNSSGTLTFDTSGVPTKAEMNTAISTALSSALQYCGTLASDSDITTAATKSTKKKGDVYAASATFKPSSTYVNNWVDSSVEAGDLFIFDGSKFDIINGENQVSNANATLTWDSSTKIATVDGTDIYVKLPSNPNSDTWRGVYVDSTNVLGSGIDTSALKFVDGSNIDAYWNSTNKTIQFNHKAPTANDSSKIALSASSTTAATWGSTDLVTGITVKRDVYGHVTDVSISSIQMPSNPDTHYTSKNVVCSTSTGTSNGVASDGAVRINHIEESTVTSSHLIDGSGTVTVTSDSNGKITITGADTNTDTKVKDTSSTSKSFLLGHSSQNTTAEAQTNASCYMSGGHLYSNAKMVATTEDVDAATIYWETL